MLAADMLTNLVRELDDHDLSVLHTRNTQNGLVGVACVNPLHKKISRPGPCTGCPQNGQSRFGTSSTTAMQFSSQDHLARGQDYKRFSSMSRCSTHNLCSEMT